MSDSQNRLAIYLPTLVEGGAERVLLNLAIGFTGRGYSVDFVLAQCEGSFMAQFPESVRLVELNHAHVRAGRSIVSLPGLVRYIRRERPDVLFTGLYANIIAIWAKRLAGVPLRLLVSEHNTISLANQVQPFGYRQLLLELIKHNYRYANVISAVSAGVADDLSRSAKIPRDIIQVIYNPIITPELERKAREEIHHPWFQPGEPPVILAVGRLVPQKDFTLLINAFARVHQTRRARLIILGEGPDRTALLSQVKQLGLEADVSLPGFVANPYPYMTHASVFALSSRWEGLPTVLVEALYCGVPTVATDCPSGTSEILHNGLYGKLVPVGDVKSFAQAIQNTLAGNGIQPLSESWKPFEMDTVVNRYLSAVGLGRCANSPY